MPQKYLILIKKNIFVQILLEHAVETPMVILGFWFVLTLDSLTVTNGCQWQLGLAIALFMSSGRKREKTASFPPAEI